MEQVEINDVIVSSTLEKEGYYIEIYSGEEEIMCIDIDVEKGNFLRVYKANVAIRLNDLLAVLQQIPELEARARELREEDQRENP
jgi:hypothetical protein